MCKVQKPCCIPPRPGEENETLQPEALHGSASGTSIRHPGTIGIGGSPESGPTSEVRLTRNSVAKIAQGWASDEEWCRRRRSWCGGRC